MISSIDLLIKYLRSKELNIDEYRLRESPIKIKKLLGPPSWEKTLLELGLKLRKLNKFSHLNFVSPIYGPLLFTENFRDPTSVNRRGTSVLKKLLYQPTTIQEG